MPAQIEAHPETKQNINFWGLSVKTIVVHTVTYFIMGLLASYLLDYRTAFAEPVTQEYMRQVSEPIVALGPAPLIVLYHVKTHGKRCERQINRSR